MVNSLADLLQRNLLPIGDGEVDRLQDEIGLRQRTLTSFEGVGIHAQFVCHLGNAAEDQVADPPEEKKSVAI